MQNTETLRNDLMTGIEAVRFWDDTHTKEELQARMAASAQAVDWHAAGNKRMIRNILTIGFVCATIEGAVLWIPSPPALQWWVGTFGPLVSFGMFVPFAIALRHNKDKARARRTQELTERILKTKPEDSNVERHREEALIGLALAIENVMPEARGEVNFRIGLERPYRAINMTGLADRALEKLKGPR